MEIKGGDSTFYWLNVNIVKGKIQHVGVCEPYVSIAFEEEKSNVGFCDLLGGIAF